jgi:hypothetical protein
MTRKSGRRRHTAETRRKISLAHKKRGSRPPAAGRAWTAEEEEWLRTLPTDEVIERTGRTRRAIWGRRNKLGLRDGRAGRTMPMSMPGRWTAEEDAVLRDYPPAEVAKKTGRTISAIWQRRRQLELTGTRVNQSGRP